jgi:PadR family transcriptional regulator PadR
MVADVGAQLRKGVVEYCVLGLLSRETMYGWQLSERLVSAGLIASIGTLYAVAPARPGPRHGSR